MLQPEQLRRVAEAFPHDVAELHGFFLSAGIQTNRVDALQTVADRVAEDRTFQRDLLSHVWVIVHARGPEVSYADLLGIVAIAAAGSAFAAAARDQDAHSLLRFLMDARKSFENRPALASLLPATNAVSTGHDVTLNHATEDVASTSRKVRNRVPTKAHPQQAGRATVLALIVLCIAVAGGVTAWFHARRLTTSASPLPSMRPVPAERAPMTASDLPANVAEIPPSVALGEGVTVRQDSFPRRHARATGVILGHDLSHANNARSAYASPGLSALPGLPTPTADAGATPLPNDTAVRRVTTDPSAGRTTVSPVPAGQRPTTRQAIPSAVLSQQLGARALAPDYEAEDRSYDARHPRLLRRRPLAGVRSDAAEQMASNDPPALFHTGNPSATAMVVRPTSLGAMAANILYSPAPAYPTAAAAARVQGEVKVQAEVDRDGNVAAVRVISGPALLRDAAVDAVQRWRYRPYVAAGRAVAMSATAVLDFELQ